MPLQELKPISAEPGQPLYAQAREAIREAVDRGLILPGEQLPSTKALSDSLGVSLVTVHRALQELVGSGVLRRGQGRGTFVHERYDERRHPHHGTRLGVVFHAECSLADSFHGQIFEGVRQEATDLGIDLVLLRFGEDWRSECSGYLFVNPLPTQLDSPPRFSSSSRSNGSSSDPILVLGARTDRPGVGYIDTDNLEIGRIAASHLASTHPARVMYVGDGSELSNSVDRWVGFRESCRGFGLAFDEQRDSIRPSDWRLDDAHAERLCEMLRQDRRPTAIFAAGYYFALGVYRAASAVGLELGRDIALVGVDDPPSAEYLSPALTTVAQPLIEVGREAVREIVRMTDGGEPIRRTLPPTLRVRASSAMRTGSRRPA